MAFALQHTLKQQENLRLGVKTPYFSTDDLIHHYRNGNLDAVIFNQETMMFPSLAHDKGDLLRGIVNCSGTARSVVQLHC